MREHTRGAGLHRVVDRVRRVVRVRHEQVVQEPLHTTVRMRMLVLTVVVVVVVVTVTIVTMTRP